MDMASLKAFCARIIGHDYFENRTTIYDALKHVAVAFGAHGNFITWMMVKIEFVVAGLTHVAFDHGVTPKSSCSIS
jgi:hypothetical protein